MLTVTGLTHPFPVCAGAAHVHACPRNWCIYMCKARCPHLVHCMYAYRTRPSPHPSPDGNAVVCVVPAYSHIQGWFYGACHVKCMHACKGDTQSISDTGAWVPLTQDLHPETRRQPSVAVEIDANKDQEASVPVNDSGTSNSGRHPLVPSMPATRKRQSWSAHPTVGIIHWWLRQCRLSASRQITSFFKMHDNYSITLLAA